jgi:hypothetical protein
MHPTEATSGIEQSKHYRAHGRKVKVFPHDEFHTFLLPECTNAEVAKAAIQYTSHGLVFICNVIISSTVYRE